MNTKFGERSAAEAGEVNPASRQAHNKKARQRMLIPFFYEEWLRWEIEGDDLLWFNRKAASN
ncbi:hypothetical protein GCM10023155_41330 [Bremerella cremea]